MRHWFSWYQPTEDYRPIKWPLPPHIPHYWCSGQVADDSYSLVAVVDAPDEEGAIAAVREYWPDMGELRFCEEKEDGWLPQSDRFPVGAPPRTL